MEKNALDKNSKNIEKKSINICYLLFLQLTGWLADWLTVKGEQCNSANEYEKLQGSYLSYFSLFFHISNLLISSVN